MDKNLHDIDKLFLDAIEPMEEKPGTQVWNNIGQVLDKEETARYKKRYANFRKLSLLLLLLLGSFCAYHFISINKIRSANKNDATPGRKLPSSISSSTAQEADTLSIASTVKPIKPIQEDAIKSVPAIIPATVADPTSVYGHSSPSAEKKITGTTGDPLIDKTGKRKNIWGEKRNASVTVTAAMPAEEERETPAIEMASPPATSRSGNGKLYTVEKVTAFPQPFAKKIIAARPFNTIPVASAPAATVAVLKRKSSSLVNHLSVSVSYAPGITENDLQDDRHDDHDNRDKIKNREGENKTTAVALSLNYTIGKHFSLQSGVGLFTTKSNSGQSKIYAEKDDHGNIRYRQNSSSGFCYLLPSFNTNPNVGDSLQASNSNTRTRYIEVPLVLHYAIGKNKLLFNPGIGIAFSSLTTAKSSATVQDNFNKVNSVTTILQGVKKTGISVLLTPEFRYSLTKKWSLDISPYMKYAVAPVTTGTVVNTYPINLGIGVGLLYKF